MKIRLILWLSLEFVIAFGISSGICFLRRDEIVARRAWSDYPTAETRAEVDKQKNITNQQHLIFGGILFAAMAAITVPVVLASSRRRLMKQV